MDNPTSKLVTSLGTLTVHYYGRNRVYVRNDGPFVVNRVSYNFSAVFVLCDGSLDLEKNEHGSTYHSLTMGRVDSYKLYDASSAARKKAEEVVSEALILVLATKEGRGLLYAGELIRRQNEVEYAERKFQEATDEALKTEGILANVREALAVWINNKP